MTVREAGALGGQARKAQLGSSGYAALGRKGGEKVAAQRGSAFYATIGQKGGAARKAGTEGSRHAEEHDPQGAQGEELPEVEAQPLRDGTLP
ncbi:MAG: general stress protein B [Myxococcota bacterium]